jgi:RNA polymerase sigma factor (sigma-70 family)
MKPVAHPIAEWSSFCQGDPMAFKAIYETYFNSLFLYGLRFSDDHDIIKDTIQNLFFKLWENRGSLAHVHQPRSYLHRALRNSLLNLHRNTKSYRHEHLDDEHYSFQLELPVESQIIQREHQLETQSRLKEAFKVLTPKQREILYLKYVKQLPFEEIADIMAITIKGSYKLHQRSLNALRIQLGDLVHYLPFLIACYIQER